MSVCSEFQCDDNAVASKNIDVHWGQPGIGNGEKSYHRWWSQEELNALGNTLTIYACEKHKARLEIQFSPVVKLAKASDLKSEFCGFESHQDYHTLVV